MDFDEYEGLEEYEEYDEDFDAENFFFEGESESDGEAKEVIEKAEDAEDSQGINKGMDVVDPKKNDTESVEEFYFDEDEDSDFESSYNTESKLSYEEQMTIFASEIFSSVLSGEDGWIEQLNIFKARLDPKLFRNEEYMIARIMHKSITNKIMAPRILEIILRKNIKDITEASGKYIDIDEYKDLNGAKEFGFIDSVLDRYKEYCAGHIMASDDFLNDVEAYKTLYTQVEIVKTMQKGIEIATTGTGSGRHRKLGVDDSMGYVKKRFADVAGLVEDQEGKGFVKMKDTLTDVTRRKSEFLCDFGMIPTLNEAYGGFYTGNFYQIMGPPKGGKSKFCASICDLLIKNGVNVSVWAQEGGIEMWSAQMRAIHCHKYHNQNKSSADVITGLPSQGDILRGDLPPQIKALEDASRLDLQTNPSYGSVEYIDRPFLLETFIEEIDTSVKSNNSKMVIIDYMQLIDTENPRLADHEVLKQSYKKLLNYCKKANVAVLTPVQYKQEVVSALASSGDSSSVDMRVSAGGSAEVIRTPDMTIPMWASAQELEQGIEYIQPMPNRLGKVVPRIKLYIDLAHCTFVEADD